MIICGHQAQLLGAPAPFLDRGFEPVGHFKSWLAETVTELATQSKPREE
jgi:hypothetical protein